jgi:hypothetical protein
MRINKLVQDHIPFFICIIIVVITQCVNPTTITVYPGPKGMAPSDKYAVKLNGIGSFTYKSNSQIDPILGPPSWSGSDKVYPPGYFDLGAEKGWDGTSAIGHTASFTDFSFTEGNVRVEITKLTPGAIESCIIRPLRHKISSEIKGNTVVFTIDKPMKISVEFDEDLKDKLFLFADLPEDNIPDLDGENVLYVPGEKNLAKEDVPEDTKVIYMAAGVHDIGKGFPLKSNQTLYLEGGSFVYGTLAINQAENVNIKGRGILCGGQFPHSDGHLISGRGTNGLNIEGIILLEAPYYNITVGGSSSGKNAMNTYENLKIISWYFNTDGIHGGSKMKAEDIFLMCADDAFLLCGKEEQIINNIVIWTLRGASIQFGWGGSGGGNSLVNNVDIIHYQSVAGEKGDYIAAISGQWAGPNNLNNIVIQNLTIEDMDSSQNKFLVMRVGPNPWMRSETKGSYSNILFRNINVMCPTSGNAIFGYADYSRISNITFENLTIQDKVVMDPSEANIRIGDFANDIVFKAGLSSIDSKILPPLNYYAEKNFSVRQGNNQWYYQYWDGRYFIFMDWDGTQWKGKETQPTILENGNMIPGNEDVVKGWISLYKGTIRILGTVKKHDITSGDGIKVSIVKSHNGEKITIWPEKEKWKVISYDDSRGIDHDITIDVALGDMIYFIVNRNFNNDHDETIWNPQISYEKND